MKKTIVLVAILLVALCGNWVSAQNQNYLPAEVQRVPQQKFIEAYKSQMGVSDEDLPTNAYKLWVNAWFGKVSSKNGVVSISLVTWEWNDSHFARNGTWLQGNSDMPYPPESKMVNALNDLQRRAEAIMGSKLPPLDGEYPNGYVERILNYLPVENSSVTPYSQGKTF